MAQQLVRITNETLAFGSKCNFKSSFVPYEGDIPMALQALKALLSTCLLF
jgi:hypothetical protein